MRTIGNIGAANFSAWAPDTSPRKWQSAWWVFIL